MAEARSGAPKIPPRIDLGETHEDISTIRHEEAPTEEAANCSGSESSMPSTDTIAKEEHVAASKPLPVSKPLPKPSVTAKPELRPAIKPIKPVKKKEIKGRPEIVIISARPMDQSNLDPSTNLKTESGKSPEGSDNNNSLNKPIITPMKISKQDTLESKRPSKPAPPTPKITAPCNSEEGSSKPSDSSAPSKVVPTPRQGMRKKNTKKEPSSSIFYVNNTDVNIKQDQTMPTETKTQHLSGEISVKSVDKPAAAPRKNKRKEEQMKKPVESESSVIRKQPETAASKPKLKPTIITAKKPKNTADVSSSDKMKDNASLNTGAQLQDNGGSNSVENPAECDPPGRPNCPPITVGEDINKDLSQPQRPKAPPNTVHEGLKHPSKEIKNEKQKDSKIKDSLQKKSKVKPRRPPMAKESARNRPSRPAPVLSNVERKAQPVKAKGLRVSEKKSVRSPDKGGPPQGIAKFDYTGETTDDLSFKAGDTIMLTSKVDNDWLVGYLEGNVMQQGLFPSSFVDIIVNLKEEDPKEKVQEPVPTDPYAVAVHDFKGQTDGELSFFSGQTIILIERTNEEWLKGKINDTVGIFPLNFIRIERDLPESTVNSETALSQAGHDSMAEKPDIDNEWCRAIHDFQGEHETDLSFVVGNEIQIVERLDNDWLKGVLSGKSGIFPASFVEMISDPEAAKALKDVATALHDYQGETSDDLSFNVGDKIKVVKRINSDWLMGELNGKEGLFPASFVESEPDSLPEPSISNNKEVEQPKNTRIAKAVHDFNGEDPSELNFKVGEIIQVIREIDDSWCEGMINDRSGIFPTSFVEIEPLPRKEISCAKALYDFDGKSEQDLSFKVGDVIQLLERVNEDWWSGSLDGKTGHFPAQFVEIIANPL